MKSIIQEGSSIAKAVEKGWEKAGSPQEFTVKIFEKAQKNFIGMTVKSAKIGIFFEDSSTATTTTSESIKTQPKQQARHGTAIEDRPEIRQRRPLKPKSEPTFTAKPEPKKIQIKETVAPQKTVSLDTSEAEWTPELIDIGVDWLKGALASLGKDSIKIVPHSQKNILQLIIKEPVLENIQQEKSLFAGFSTSVIQAIKKKTRKSLKGYKISILADYNQL